MPPVAAMNPSGSSDCSKLSETRRRRPLSDDDAAGRFVTGDGGSSERGNGSFEGDAESREGKGSASLLDGDGIVMRDGGLIDGSRIAHSPASRKPLD